MNSFEKPLTKPYPKEKGLEKFKEIREAQEKGTLPTENIMPDDFSVGNSNQEETIALGEGVEILKDTSSESHEGEQLEMDLDDKVLPVDEGDDSPRDWLEAIDKRQEAQAETFDSEAFARDMKEREAAMDRLHAIKKVEAELGNKDDKEE